MENYFRITAQLDNGTSFILDSHGMFEKLWEFSVYVKSKGATIIEATSSEQFIDINTQKEIQRYSDKLFLIACDPDPAKWIDYEYEGKKYKAIQVRDSIYIPRKD